MSKYQIKSSDKLYSWSILAPGSKFKSSQIMVEAVRSFMDKSEIGSLIDFPFPTIDVPPQVILQYTFKEPPYLDGDGDFTDYVDQYETTIERIVNCGGGVFMLLALDAEYQFFYKDGKIYQIAA